MNCYFCSQRRPGGTRFGATTAIGICRNCGVGVCEEQGHKASYPGALLLCDDCAQVDRLAHLESEEAVDVNRAMAEAAPVAS